MLKYVIIIGLVGAVAAAVLISARQRKRGGSRTLLIEEHIREKIEDIVEEVKEEIEEVKEEINEELEEEIVVELSDDQIDDIIDTVKKGLLNKLDDTEILKSNKDDDDEEIDAFAQMRAEEEAAEACYGNCMNCRHYCKDPDPDIVFGHCHLNDTEMLYDDGCYDFEDRD